MSTEQRPRRSKAEAGEQTRASLLDAGAALLRERPVGALFHQVTASEVARRAGRTIGAFYHHWPDQDSYRRDLLSYVLAPEQVPSQETAAAVADALAGGLDTAEIVRRNARDNLAFGVTRPEFVLSVVLWGQARQDDDVRALLQHLYRGATDALVPMYGALFAANGWVPRPPFTLESVAVTITALLDGLVMRAVVEPAAVPLRLPAEDGTAVPDDDAWDLFGTVVAALLAVMLMPADAAADVAADPLASPADVRDVARAVWEGWARRG